MKKHVFEALLTFQNEKYVFEAFFKFTKWKNTSSKRFHIYKMKNTFLQRLQVYKIWKITFSKRFHTYKMIEAFLSLQNEKIYFISWDKSKKRKPKDIKYILKMLLRILKVFLSNFAVAAIWSFSRKTLLS